MRLLAMWLATTVAFAPAPLPQVDRFDVDAAVGGVVRRDLREIGRAVLQYVDLPGSFRMKGVAHVEHREKKKVYRFQLDMTFRTQGRRLEVLANHNAFSQGSEDIRERVERVVPFFYLVRALPIPAEAEEQTRTFIARHGYFVLRYERREQWVEATLRQDDALVGRFRLQRGTPNTLERIEIPASESVMVLFTRKNPNDR